MIKLTDIEGIGDAYADKLQAAGIRNVGSLLERGSTRAGRDDLVARSGISDRLILKWVNHADLARVKGIGGQFAELLEHAGVDTVPELAQRNAENLHARLAAVNAEKRLTRVVPSASLVAGWVRAAQSMDRKVRY